LRAKEPNSIALSVNGSFHKGITNYIRALLKFIREHIKTIREHLNYHKGFYFIAR